VTSPRSAALAATATPPPPAPPALTPPPAVSAPSHLRPHTVAPTTLGGGATEVGRFTASRNRPRKLMLVGASLAGLAGVLAFVMLRGHDATVAPRAGGEPSPAAAPAAEARTARAETPPPPPSAPATSSITLTGLPVGATVRLDGRPTPSPLVVPRGPERHQLAIEADGFEAWEQSVDGSADRTVAVRLKAKAAVTTAPARGKHKNERRRNSSHFNGFNDLY
jgi:hypothetical protein